MTVACDSGPTSLLFFSLIVCFETKQHEMEEVSFFAKALNISGGDWGLPQYTTRAVAVSLAAFAEGEGTLKPGSTSTL